jgi:hypothetical protein
LAGDPALAGSYSWNGSLGYGRARINLK